MAAPLMSLLSPGQIKHVVPWKNRSEFLSVCSDLYSEDEELQGQAIKNISVWKSRSGSKLSVAIESSAMLTQAHLDHLQARKLKRLQEREMQLRSMYSLALIRFVNHITEKGQTKATAQPVHLIAREFGIPEWIVRLRHDATHSSLPCLDALANATKWALNYLKENFWAHQTADATPTDRETREEFKLPKISDIRRAFYDFQKVRYQELNSSSEDKESHSESLKVLHNYLVQNRLSFIKCLLEDGVLISTEEQLKAFRVSSEDLISQPLPTIPVEITEFWRPLFKKLNNTGALPCLLHLAMFSVTSGEGIRNYQLVAWLSFLLSQCSESTSRGRKRKRRRQDALFKNPVSFPKKTLLAACLQNINQLTAHLLKYLVDKESLGMERYNKLMKLLHIHTQSSSREMSSDESSSDTVYTVEDLKQLKEKHSASQCLTPDTLQDIQSNCDADEVPWAVCTDFVDWSTIPLGTIPDVTTLNDEDNDNENDADEEHLSTKKGRDGSPSSDDNTESYVESRRKGANKRRSLDDDSDNSDNSLSPSPKRPTLLVTDTSLL